jgi:ribosomal protein S18 acetylase RimI-like enzyme
MICIRRYQPLDALDLERCFIALQSFERRLEPNRVDGERIASLYRQYLLDRCEQTDGTIIVAEDNGAVVGFVAVFAHLDSESLIETTTDYAYISDLVVLPAYRGHGIGRALLQHAESFAKDHGAKIVKVDVLIANVVAHELYRAIGFQDHEVRLIKVLDPSV